MRWGIAGLIVGLSLGSRLMPAQTRASESTDSLVTTLVTYVSGPTVYLEVGTKQGVRVGTTFAVRRGGQVVGELTAQFVSSNRASCVVTGGTSQIVVNDTVWYAPSRDITPASQGVVTVQSGAPSSPRGRPVRGRIGVRYLVIDQPGGAKLTQPSLDLRLDGAEIRGTGFGLEVDVRTQRSAVSTGALSPRSPANLTRVYQANMQYQGGNNRIHLAAGRQFATALAPLGIFDGLSLELRHTRWSAGLLAGTEPEAVTFGVSGALTEYGAWVQRHNAPGGGRPWSLTLGAVGSYDRGEINREFGYLRVTASSGRYSIYASQELDLNRGWKRATEGGPVTMTSSFASGQITLSRALTISGGVDSRRRVRLYRDFENPELLFDDAFRQGTWGGLALRASARVRLMSTVRTSGGGPAGPSRALTTSLLISRLTPLQLGLRIRGSRYVGPSSEGVLGSLALEASPTRAMRVSLNVGERTSKQPGGNSPASRLRWAGADIDVSLGRSLYILMSTYRESGTPSASRQSFGSISWRF